MSWLGVAGQPKAAKGTDTEMEAEEAGLVPLIHFNPHVCPGQHTLLIRLPLESWLSNPLHYNALVPASAFIAHICT